MRSKNILKLFILFVALILLSSLAASADGEIAMPDEFESLADELPDGVKESLPEGMLDSKSVGDTLREVLEPSYMLDAVGKMLGDEMTSALTLACVLIGVTVISALTRALISSAESATLSGAFRMCSSLAVFSAVIGAEVTQLYRCSDLLDSLGNLMGSMIPITGIVWAMGGNVTTASAGSATLYTFLSISENLCSKTILPVCLMLTVVALGSAVAPEMNLGGISGAVKKTYNFVIGLIMTLLVSVLGLQTTLTGSADSIGAKTAKMVSSTVIPVVGGSVGETLRSVAGSVEYIKSVFGISSIVFIVFLVAPTLIGILLSRAVFIIVGGIADMLGCDRESRLLGEISNIYGCMLGVVAMSSVMFILGLEIFVKSAVAIA